MNTRIKRAMIAAGIATATMLPLSGHASDGTITFTGAVTDKEGLFELARTAVLAFAEDQAGGGIQFAGEAQLREHAIDAVGLFVHVFDKQNPSGGFDLVGCAHGGGDQCEVTAEQRAAGDAWAYGAQHVCGAERIVGRVADAADGIGFK